VAESRTSFEGDAKRPREAVFKLLILVKSIEGVICHACVCRKPYPECN